MTNSYDQKDEQTETDTGTAAIAVGHTGNGGVATCPDTGFVPYSGGGKQQRAAHGRNGKAGGPLQPQVGFHKLSAENIGDGHIHAHRQGTLATE